MIWGSQYDAMLNWMLKGDDASKVASSSTKHDKTTTGSTEGDVMNNIYDLGNNLREWTLEAYNTGYRAYRGGSYNVTNAPSGRNSDGPTLTDVFYGSRLALYIL